MNTFQILQLGMSLLGPIQEIIATTTSNLDLVSKIKQLSGPFATAIEAIGAEFFPKAAADIHIAGAIIAAFDPNFTRWIQGAMNGVLHLSPPLVVDGIYGDHTKAAVEQLQAMLGIKVDGLAGKVTEAAFKAFLAKVPGITTAPVTTTPAP